MIYQWLEYTNDNAFNGWNIPFRIPINTNGFLYNHYMGLILITNKPTNGFYKAVNDIPTNRLR